MPVVDPIEHEIRYSGIYKAGQMIHKLSCLLGIVVWHQKQQSGLSADQGAVITAKPPGIACARLSVHVSCSY